MEKGNNLLKLYFKNYKKFLLIPFGILIIAIFLIFSKIAATGEFINKDISLKGGITLTILESKNIDISALEAQLIPLLTPNSVSIRYLTSTGKNIGILIESDIEGIDQVTLDNIIGTIEKTSNINLEEGDYSLETTGSALGKSFFNQIMIALLLAFIFMGIVVFIYFRNFIPSGAVILSAFSDIVVTVAIVNLMGIKMGTAGIAALLMLIGYSIDTDIMLTTKVLKRKEMSLEKAITDAFKTGMTMTLTTIAAITVALIFTQSEVIRQIMIILLIGLSIDIINTWIQNSGLLIWYVERKK